MNSRQLGILSAIAFVIIAGAVWIGVGRTPRVETSAELLPALKGKLDKIVDIKVFKPGDALAVELTRDGTKWTVKQRNGFAADAEKIDGLLIALEGAKIREQKTANPDNYAALGVQELSAEGATGSRVELTGVEPTIKLIVGKQDATQHGSFVRRAGEPQSWLISETITAPAEVNAWLHRELLDVGADRVQEVAVQPAEGPRYSAIKNKRADANFDVTGIPKGRELNSVSAANAAAQSLVGLQLDDVRAATELASSKPTAQTAIRTFDGLVLDIQGYMENEKHWIVAKASVDEALAKRFHMPVATPAPEPKDGAKDDKETKDAAPPNPEESLAAAVTKVKTDADALNKRLDGWAFEVAAYKYDSLFKPMEQLLKKNEPLLKKK